MCEVWGQVNTESGLGQVPGSGNESKSEILMRIKNPTDSRCFISVKKCFSDRIAAFLLSIEEVLLPFIAEDHIFP